MSVNRNPQNRAEMNSRRRFLETMQYGTPDRVPYFEEGIRDEVIKAWHSQGLPPNVDVSKLLILRGIWNRIGSLIGRIPKS